MNKQPDRVLGRAVCESIQHATPWMRWTPQRHGSAPGVATAGLVIVAILYFLGRML